MEIKEDAREEDKALVAFQKQYKEQCKFVANMVTTLETCDALLMLLEQQMTNKINGGNVTTMVKMAIIKMKTGYF